MKKLKTTLIHWLGGYTVEESVQSDANAYALSALAHLSGIKAYMDSIYGCTAEEWCSKAYEHVNKQLKLIIENNQ